MSNINPPIQITKEKILKFKQHIDNTFNAFDNNGNIDLDKCQRNISYSAGDTFTNYNGLLWQEESKLAEIETDLNTIKAKIYDDLKRNVINYDVNAKGMDILLTGNEEVNKKQLEYDKQKAFVDYLQRTVNQISYYANAVDVMLKREDIRGKYGV